MLLADGACYDVIEQNVGGMNELLHTICVFRQQKGMSVSGYSAPVKYVHFNYSNNNATSTMTSAF